LSAEIAIEVRIFNWFVSIIEPHGLAEGLEPDELRDAVDVTGDDVPVPLVAVTME
jgi:hypothetical protein